MLLPMLSFFLMLVWFGGIASFAVLIDHHAARRAPAPFSVFSSGVGFFVLFILCALIDAYVSHRTAGLIALMAPVFGGVGGGFLGYQLGLRWRRRAVNYPGKAISWE